MLAGGCSDVKSPGEGVIAADGRIVIRPYEDEAHRITH